MILMNPIYLSSDNGPYFSVDVCEVKLPADSKYRPLPVSELCGK